jgi:hypothetical protein
MPMEFIKQVRGGRGGGGGERARVLACALLMSLLRQFNLPVLLLGGGGYTIRNVA